MNEDIFEGFDTPAAPTFTDLIAPKKPKVYQVKEQTDVKTAPQPIASPAVTRTITPGTKDLKPVQGFHGWGTTTDYSLVALMAKQGNIQPLMDPNTVRTLMEGAIAYVVHPHRIPTAIFVVHGVRVRGIWFANQNTGSMNEREQIRFFIKDQGLDASGVKCWCNCADPTGCSKAGKKMASSFREFVRLSFGATKSKPDVQKTPQVSQPITFMPSVNKDVAQVLDDSKVMSAPRVPTSVSDLPAGWRKVTSQEQLYGIVAKWDMGAGVPKLVEKDDEVFVDDYLGIVVVISPKAEEIKSISYPKEAPQNPEKVEFAEKERAKARIRQVQKLARKKNIKKYRRICFCNDVSCNIGPFHQQEIR